MNYTPETLMVRPIDHDKLIAHFTAFIKLKKNQVIRTSKDAITHDNVVVDNECCYSVLDKFFTCYGFNLDYAIQLPIFIDTKKKGGTSISFTPAFYINFHVKELKTFLKKPVTLKEFMIGRFNYNPIITANTREFMEFINAE